MDQPPFPGAPATLDAAAVALHEWYQALRSAGFARPEALYIITQPIIEPIRLDWKASHE